ncbi:glucan 1,4-alpha-glucosidase [Streptomyces nanshensis]|nr:glucan 1,4-alpha-glucosidase [Streptomyces nanshensis]
MAGVARAEGADTPAAARASGEAPGGPGASTVFTPADKTGFGTSRTKESLVWFTLQGGRMSETYYPDLSTPAARQTQLVVTDGRTFVERLSDGESRTELCGRDGAPVFRLTSKGTGWCAVTRYVTDPERASVLIDVDVRSETNAPLRVFLLHDPSLSGDGDDDSAFPQDGALVAKDKHAASALVAHDGFAESTVGYLGVNDGWSELSENNGNLEHHYATAGPGNVLQTGRLRIDGRTRTRQTVVLGFGEKPADAVSTARRSLRQGFDAAARAYERGWSDYLAGLPGTPGSLRTPSQQALYTASVVTLAAGEDKRNPGAFIASPSMPWDFASRHVVPETGPYHLVWPRDQYQIGTGLLAAGDRAAAERALDFMLRTQESDGHWAQNCKVDGEPFWTNIQLDETAAPMLLAWLLDRHDARTLDRLVRAADFILGFKSEEGYKAPYSQQERWEEQSGYSPSTIASVIAGLVCLGDLLERGGQGEKAAEYLKAADKWQKSVEDWTVTTKGPDSSEPYYLRLTKNGKPDSGMKYELGNNIETPVDQRTVVDAGFLELVRLGVKRADDPVILNSLAVVDRKLAVDTPSGRHWYRYSGDGYGEQPNGEQWTVNRPEVKTTHGRLWPIFSGERGEYELLCGARQSAAGRLRDMASTAGETLMLPEQVWDDRPPVPREQSGTGTASATPLAWTHAQYVRLARSLERGTPVEYPTVVAERYLRR